ncbi:hypothetical protein M0R19_02145 [Candidatus Pacearchaeota archaeon]|jgi:hypothetical protein|nr:hypothetical protein [Candidatus Pacearchaeota archaeon]
MTELTRICISQGLCFRKILNENKYCELCYGGREVQCEFLGKKDQNNLHTCNYEPDFIEKEVIEILI